MSNIDIAVILLDHSILSKLVSACQSQSLLFIPGHINPRTGRYKRFPAGIPARTPAVSPESAFGTHHYHLCWAPTRSAYKECVYPCSTTRGTVVVVVVGDLVAVTNITAARSRTNTFCRRRGGTRRVSKHALSGSA